MRPEPSSAQSDRSGAATRPRPRGVRLLVMAAVIGWGVSPSIARAGAPGAVDFGRDVLPILSDNCFACHGPDARARKADLRLDIKEGAVRDEGGVVVPGQADESELIARVASDDPDEVMPPPKSKKVLTPGQVEVLRRWVDQGASWGRHWAFEPPRRPTLPAVRGSGLVEEPDRPLRPGPTRSGGDRPLARGREGDPDPPGDARPDRPAPLARGGRRLPRRRTARRLRAAGRPPARQPALRRALGPALARPGPLRRLQRLQHRRPAVDLEVPRLGHRRPEPRPALRRVRHRPARRRPPPGRLARPGRRDRLPPQHADQPGGGDRPRAVPRRVGHRPRPTRRPPPSSA